MIQKRFYSLIFLFATLLVTSSLAQAQAQAQAQDNILLIDTRSPAEYEQGHAQGAVLIPYDAIEAGILKLSPAKDTPIYLYCGSGGRAEIARKRLEHRGYTQVTNLGGLSDANAFIESSEESP
ncbi:MAG: rhodanese-like domain-containing protein [Halioglobus sp.]